MREAEDLSFSIVLATYGRGRRIEPTIESALAQTHRNFELIVVGDGCADETEAIVASYAREMRGPATVAWHNLPSNSGSQSFPNNAGIMHARGDWICYLGHDDIWSPDHLESIAQTIAFNEGLDFVVGGCVFYGPPGSEYYFVTGLFEAGDTDAPFRHFFPPTSIAHRRDVTDRLGGWSDPREIAHPVDADFLVRAAQAGMRFTPTGRITAHKFAAGHRYLSYLRPDCEEQRDMFRTLRATPRISFDDIIAASQRAGLFMTRGYSEFTSSRRGHSFENNRQNKGISRPALQRLRERTVIGQADGPRGLDWYQLESGRRSHRWSGPNPRPKILIPFTGENARIAIEVLGTRPGLDLHEVSLLVEGRQVATRCEDIPEIGVAIIAEIPLAVADYTVLMLETPMFVPSEHYDTGDHRRLGIAVSDIVIEPI